MRRPLSGRRLGSLVPAVVLTAILLPGGCDGGGGSAPGPGGATPPEGERTAPARPSARRKPPAPATPPARCPAGLAGCRTAYGRVLYVERLDPDGDGDAHFVLASRQSITGPGISVIDVRRGLRPDPLPAPGARISAAGPVHRGSYGQRQIEAVAVRVHSR